MLPASHEERNGGEDDKIENRPAHKKWKIEPLLFVVVAGRFTERAHRPSVNLMRAEEHGKKEQRHQRQSHERSGRQIANGGAPFPARQRLHHHDDKRAEREPDPEKPGEEVGMKELGTIKSCAD